MSPAFLLQLAAELAAVRQSLDWFVQCAQGLIDLVPQGTCNTTRLRNELLIDWLIDARL